ncbi:hypothetical protein I6N95_20825 [Vagococcus sp. BWB3-3]|uniref:DUF2922 domain-containing protein n=1 Tax=Vagococcus allomyrinae TaxID=2794353 RepID=A0A940PF66_9ENTE|nr:hypothetical protein [Vagococcus allomyrinae]MBP1043472.1 hypothetical protein [Vagococcus allomyrinae]
MSYRKRIQLVLTNQEGRRSRISVPIFMEGFDAQILKEQVEDILDLGVLLDPKDYNHYLVRIEQAVRIEVLKTALTGNIFGRRR